MQLTIQSKRVNIFAVITARHVLLAKTNGVFALSNTVENFEVRLRDTLATQTLKRVHIVSATNTNPAREVHFHGKDTNILGTGYFCIELGEGWRDHFRSRKFG